MSRHQFPGLDGMSTVAIGWDRPLQTFFVHVLRPHPHLAGEEETVAWHGTASGELGRARDAVTIARGEGRRTLGITQPQHAIDGKDLVRTGPADDRAPKPAED